MDITRSTRVKFEEITAAAYRIKNTIRYTDCPKSESLSQLTGIDIFLKRDITQVTGTFKERGVRYAMIKMAPHIKGVVVASSGDHALATAYHGFVLNIPVTVIMPTKSTISSIQRCKSYMADVIVKGANLSESQKIAQAYAGVNGIVFLDGHDHPDIITGQGTVGLEVWEQIPNLDAIIMPAVGGSLVAGVTVAVKNLNNRIKIIAVEHEKWASLTAAIKAGEPIEINVNSHRLNDDTIPKVGPNCFATLRHTLDNCVPVKEQYIAQAMLRLFELERNVVDVEAASTLGAILQGSLGELKGKNVCLILSGGNTNYRLFARALDTGLMVEGRLLKIDIYVSSDRVEMVGAVVSTIEELGGHIVDLMHERTWLGDQMCGSIIKTVCETQNGQHTAFLKKNILSKFKQVIFNDGKNISSPLLFEKQAMKVRPQRISPKLDKEKMSFHDKTLASEGKQSLFQFHKEQEKHIGADKLSIHQEHEVLKSSSISPLHQEQNKPSSSQVPLLGQKQIEGISADILPQQQYEVKKDVSSVILAQVTPKDPPTFSTSNTCHPECYSRMLALKQSQDVSDISEEKYEYLGLKLETDTAVFSEIHCPSDCRLELCAKMPPNSLCRHAAFSEESVEPTTVQDSSENSLYELSQLADSLNLTSGKSNQQSEFCGEYCVSLLESPISEIEEASIREQDIPTEQVKSRFEDPSIRGYPTLKPYKPNGQVKSRSLDASIRDSLRLEPHKSTQQVRPGSEDASIQESPIIKLNTPTEQLKSRSGDTFKQESPLLKQEKPTNQVKQCSEDASIREYFRPKPDKPNEGIETRCESPKQAKPNELVESRCGGTSRLKKNISDYRKTRSCTHLCICCETDKSCNDKYTTGFGGFDICEKQICQRVDKFCMPSRVDKATSTHRTHYPVQCKCRKR